MRARARRVAALAALLLAAVAALVGRPAAPGRGGSGAWTFDARDTRQEIAGFGGTIGWIYPDASIRERVADLLFTDLGASILRVRAICRNDDPGDEGSLEPANDDADPLHVRWEAFDFRGCEEEQALLAGAAARRGVRAFVAAAWSPPGWMKESGSRKMGGGLKPGMEEEFAELWAAYLLGMRDRYGIEFTHLTILNEPDVVPRPYATCHVEPEALGRLAEAVARRLDREGLPAALLGPDVSYASSFARYVPAFLRGGAAARRAPALSTHLYSLEGRGFYDLAGARGAWGEIAAAAGAAGRPLWMTEYANYSGDWSGEDPGSGREALAWAHHVHLALTDGGCSAVLHWGLFFDKREESLLYAARSHAASFEITPKYHTAKAWFRHVRPGMVRVEGRRPRGAPAEVLPTAFVGPEGLDWTVVAVNLAPEPRPFAFVLRPRPGRPPPRALRRYRAEGGAPGRVLPPVSLAAGGLADLLPPESVTAYTTHETSETPSGRLPVP